jgi:hypothetical protein
MKTPSRIDCPEYVLVSLSVYKMVLHPGKTGPRLEGKRERITKKPRVISNNYMESAEK